MRRIAPEPRFQLWRNYDCGTPPVPSVCREPLLDIKFESFTIGGFSTAFAVKNDYGVAALARELAQEVVAAEKYSAIMLRIDEDLSGDRPDSKSRWLGEESFKGKLGILASN